MANNVLTLNFTAASYDIAPNGQLSLPSLMRYLQQAAHQHATDLNVGFHHLKEQNIFWVLSGFTIQTNQLPGFDETFMVETWPRENNRLFSMRDFLVYYNNLVVARATSAWLMVDLNSKRPVRPDHLLAGIDFLPERKAFKEEPLLTMAINRIHQPQLREIGFSDLDINRHVNNTRYVEWVLDAIHRASNQNRKIVRLSIQFSSEFVEGETASIYMQEGSCEKVLNIEIVHENGRTGVKAAVEFSK